MIATTNVKSQINDFIRNMKWCTSSIIEPISQVSHSFSTNKNIYKVHINRTSLAIENGGKIKLSDWEDNPEKFDVLFAESLYPFLIKLQLEHKIEIDTLSFGFENSQVKEYPLNRKRFLNGKTFVITGTLWWKRADYENIIIYFGGKLSGAINGNTSYLIVGEDPGENKLTKANQLKKPIIKESLFRRWLLQNKIILP